MITHKNIFALMKGNSVELFMISKVWIRPSLNSVETGFQKICTLFNMVEMNGFEMNWNTVKKKTIVDLMLESFLHLFTYL